MFIWFAWWLLLFSESRNAACLFTSSSAAAPLCPSPSCHSLALPQNTFLCWVQCLCALGERYWLLAASACMASASLCLLILCIFHNLKLTSNKSGMHFSSQGDRSGAVVFCSDCDFCSSPSFFFFLLFFITQKTWEKCILMSVTFKGEKKTCQKRALKV